MKILSNRREFLRRAGCAALGAGAVAALAAPAPSASPALTIIDTHVHFYDPSRPQGVPWPPKDDKVLYRTVLPKDYLALAQARPVAGVVVVEASPLVEDNAWILDLAAREKLIAGFVGQLPVGAEGFREHLERCAANPLFRGLRLRPAPPQARWDDALWLDDLKWLAERDLSLDLVGGKEILELAVRLAKRFPEFRIVLDHLAGVRIDGKPPAADWLDAMRTAAKHRNVFCKVSGLVEGTGQRGGQAPRDTDFYKPILGALWEIFGEDRLIYGSNWPVCEHFAPLETVQRIALDYFTGKGSRALRKVFSENARRAYQWVKR